MKRKLIKKFILMVFDKDYSANVQDLKIVHKNLNRKQVKSWMNGHIRSWNDEHCATLQLSEFAPEKNESDAAFEKAYNYGKVGHVFNFERTVQIGAEVGLSFIIIRVK